MKQFLIIALAATFLSLGGLTATAEASRWNRLSRKAYRQSKRDFRRGRRDLRRSYRRSDRRYSPRLRYIQPRYGYGYSPYPYGRRYRGGGVYLPGFSVQW